MKKKPLLQIGSKTQGVLFPDGYQEIGFPNDMDEYIGQEATVVDWVEKPTGIRYELKFNNGMTYWYPEDFLSSALPLPILDKAMKVLVSDDEETWFEESIIAQLSDKSVITKDLIKWSYYKFINNEDKNS